ncbi:MAG: hypothetical protein GX591_14290 [Planctomycetes bacterium]|nr:hypothetical protein [Planctomycetota bacterium]
MPITLEQVQTQLQTAWAAINAGELSYSHDGNQTTFQSLDAMQRHIEWLRGLERELIAEAGGTVSAIAVRFTEGT